MRHVILKRALGVYGTKVNSDQTEQLTYDYEQEISKSKIRK